MYICVKGIKAELRINRSFFQVLTLESRKLETKKTKQARTLAATAFSLQFSMFDLALTVFFFFSLYVEVHHLLVPHMS